MPAAPILPAWRRIPSFFPPDETPKPPEHILVTAIKYDFRINRVNDWRVDMYTSISCKELGIDCNFVISGEAGEIVIDSLIRHVKEDHTDDWFEIEEIYQAACSVARAKAA
jgi:predicted small metal-binding protein